MQAFGLSLAAFTSFLLLSVIVFRAVDIKRTMHALVGTFAAVLVAAVAAAVIFLRDIHFLAFFGVYLCLSLIFVQVFSIFYKSISLRLVLDIQAHSGNRASQEWVYAESIFAGSFLRRLAILEEGGLISRQGDTLSLTPAGRRVAHRLLTAQKILGIENSG